MSLKNISFGIYAFFISVLLLCLVSIVFFDQDNTKHNDIGQNIPNIELKNFNFYLLTPNALEAQAWGERGFRYRDYDEAYDLFVYQINKNDSKDESFTPYTKIQQNIFFMPQGVYYLQNGDSLLWSDNGQYNYNKREFQGKGEWLLMRDGTQINGQDLFYRQDDGFLSGSSLDGYVGLE